MLENWDGKERDMESGEATTKALRFIVHNFPLRHCYYLSYNVPIIIFITYRPRLPLPKPE